MKSDPGKIRILLVEDHVPTAAMLTAMLSGLGYEKIKHATSTERAIDKLRQRPFDLLLCDYRLGIINGLTLVRMIRKPGGIASPNLPIIMVTAHAEPELVAEARAAGVNAVLVKPVQPEKLMQCINEVFVRPPTFAKAADYAGPDRRRRQEDIHPGRRQEDREGKPIPRSKWIVPPKT